MSDAALPPASLLPPPSATILLYAADGLAAWKNHIGPKGFPQMPERAIWVPMFRELVNSEEGMHTLHALTRSGMQAWRCSPENINTLKSAFRDITLRALLIATLDDYADTGGIRVLMPPPPSRPNRPRLHHVRNLQNRSRAERRIQLHAVRRGSIRTRRQSRADIPKTQ